MIKVYEFGLPSHTRSPHLYKNSLTKRIWWEKPLLGALSVILILSVSSAHYKYSLTKDYIQKGLTKKEAKVSLLNKLQERRLGKLDEIIGAQVLNYMYEKHEKSHPKNL